MYAIPNGTENLSDISDMPVTPTVRTGGDGPIRAGGQPGRAAGEPWAARTAAHSQRDPAGSGIRLAGEDSWPTVTTEEFLKV
jgi:hypothetical protein